MGYRMRKSVKLGPGLRLTATNRGMSLRVGNRGGGMSWSTTGRRTVSAGIPGSGLRYQQSVGEGSSRARTTRPAPVAVAPPRPPKPGLFAPHYEKAFYKAINAYAAGQAEQALALFRESSANDTSDKSVADDLFAGLLCVQTGRDEDAIPYLEKVVSSQSTLPDALMRKYVPAGYIQIGITEAVHVEVPFGSLAAALALAEVYQGNDRLDEAIGLLEQLVDALPDEPALKLSLCDLYAEAEDWEALVDFAAGTANEDDLTCQIRIYQAQAFRAQAMPEAALEALKDALRSKKRDSDLLRAARYERAQVYLAAGKRGMARKELERIYADQPDYRDVKDLIAHTSG